MWFLMIFWRVFRGFWRLLTGLVIGAVLYIALFFNYKDYWQKIHDHMHDFMAWLVSHPVFADYSQWSTLLHLDEKLTFALFILTGRMIWMFIESTLISFPYWLIFGRHKGEKAQGIDRVVEQEVADVAPDKPSLPKPPLPKQGIPPAQGLRPEQLQPASGGGGAKKV